MSASTEQIAKVNSLENGKGLQYLMNESYKIFGNPSLLFNMEYELVASTENVVTDDYLWNEIVQNGAFSSETIDFFKTQDFHDTVASSKSIALLESEHLEYDRFYGRILNSDNSTVVDLIITACNEPFGEDTPMAVEAFCEKISKEISGIEFYQQYGVIYHETLIRKLLDGGNNGDIIIFSDHVANLYEGLKANLFVAVVDAGKCNSVNNGLEDFRDLFKKMQAEHKYAAYSNYVVAIVSTDNTELSIGEDLNKLSEFFELNNIYAGISGRFENLFDLRKYYNEAVKALKHGLETNGHGYIFLCDDDIEE